MNDATITNVVRVLLGVVALAIVAVLVSGGAQTGNVLGSFGNAMKQILCAAVAPVTGTSCGGTLVTSRMLPIGSGGGGAGGGPPTYGQPGYPGCPFGMTC